MGYMKLPLPAREISAVARRHRLTYDTFNKACKLARAHLSLHPPKRGQSLPKLLPESSLRAYFRAVDETDNMQHQIMLRLFLYTAVRVAELCMIRLDEIDVDAGKIFIAHGKGDKSRYVLFKAGFRLTLKLYVETRRREKGEYLFESTHHRPYSTRRVQQIVAEYGAIAKIPERIHPHMFRHIALTHLTKSGLTDAQIQLVSGHASKDSLAIYQHLALSDVAEDYQKAMTGVIE